MEIRKVSALRGPNIWATFPVIEATVDFGVFKESVSCELPGFNERLLGWLPTLCSQRHAVDERDPFADLLTRGASLPHTMARVCIELQSLAGAHGNFVATHATAEPGVHKVLVDYHEEDLARAAVESACKLLAAAAHGHPFDVRAELKRLFDMLHHSQLGPSTRSIVKAAAARGIPVRRLNDGNLVQLGYGARQRRIWTAETDRTSAIAESIAQDKELTRQLLRAVGVPAPSGRPVTDAEDAWRAALEIGGPVVVKPQYGNQGRGVATNLTTREQVLKAYAAAREEERTILVESFAPGDDYRLLVIGGRLIAAARREPAQVTGDGVCTVNELVERANADPRRGDDHSTALSKICIDQIALTVLAEQGFTPDSVPPAGAKVLIRRNANLSTGGTANDVTDRVHPAVEARAIEAAQVIGLDIAGIDVVALDLGRPLEEQNGVIVEVNAGPGLRMHIEPSAGKPRPVGAAIVDTLFALGETGRIPIVAVTGTNGKTTTTRCVAHILQRIGRHVGMTCTEGIYVDRRRIESGDCSGPQSARTILMNPKVDAAVLEVARGGVLREGLGFDQCDVAVVTNIGEGDHLGIAGIETVEQLAVVKRTPVTAVHPGGYAVLNAADPHTAAMADRCRGGVIFFALDEQNSQLASHRLNGGRVAFVADGQLTLAEGSHIVARLPVADIPITRQGRVSFMVENALASAAAAWGLGIAIDDVLAGLASFSSEWDMTPGRFNVLSLNGATVVVDYGHNISALAAMLEAMSAFPHERRIAVYSAAGDRRDEDMVRQGQMLGDAFDRIFLYEDQYKRGRADGEIINLFTEGAKRGSRVKQIEGFQGSPRCIDAALEALRPGDFLLLQADTVDDTVAYIREYLVAHPELSRPAAEASDEEAERGAAVVVAAADAYARASQSR